MQCPYCKETDRDRVLDSRPTEGSKAIRRRRLCEACGRRFTTYERVESNVRLVVIKKDGGRVPFDRSKILAGLQKACYKRPVTAEQLDKLVDEVEEQIVREHDREVSSQRIGALVARGLRRLDKVAYLRFASVYHDFQDVTQFIEEAQEVIERASEQTPGQRTLFDDDITP